MILVAQDHENSGTRIAWQALLAGHSALEVVELGIRAVEANDADRSVGSSGWPNAAGQVELDAGIMDGRTRASGAVGALRGYAHPISVAAAVMQRLPHVLLVGEGAARFAAEIGAERSGEVPDQAVREAWAVWLGQAGLDHVDPGTPLIDAVVRGMDPQQPLEAPTGTTTYLAQDMRGSIAAGVSTSGWAWKYPGRLGDSPLAGAGFYADNRFGAAACTGLGELAIRSGLARLAVALIGLGRSVEQAVIEALRDALELPGPRESLTVTAIDTHGAHFAASIRPRGDAAHYLIASGADPEPGLREPFYLLRG